MVKSSLKCSPMRCAGMKRRIRPVRASMISRPSSPPRSITRSCRRSHVAAGSRAAKTRSRGPPCKTSVAAAASAPARSAARGIVAAAYSRVANIGYGTVWRPAGLVRRQYLCLRSRRGESHPRRQKPSCEELHHPSLLLAPARSLFALLPAVPELNFIVESGQSLGRIAARLPSNPGQYVSANWAVCFDGYRQGSAMQAGTFTCLCDKEKFAWSS